LGFGRLACEQSIYEQQEMQVKQQMQQQMQQQWNKEVQEQQDQLCNAALQHKSCAGIGLRPTT
jgi:hypothetical protein